MSLLSFLCKSRENRATVSLCDQLCNRVVLASLNFRTDFPTEDNQVAAEIGAEFLYLLLHLLDRKMCSVVGQQRRDVMLPDVGSAAVYEYCQSVLNKIAPSEVFDELLSRSLTTCNKRQAAYSKCRELLTGPLAANPGSMAFAFSFYVHRAKGLTDLEDLDDGLLTGAREIQRSDVGCIPASWDSLPLTQQVLQRLCEFRIDDTVKSFK